MKLSIAEFTDAIGTMNTCLETKQKNLELLEKAINSFIDEEALQGKSYQSAKNYFRDMHLPVVRGMILAYEEIKRANTSCLNDLHTQVSSDYSMKIDTEGLAYYLNEAKTTLSQLEELEQNSTFAQGQHANIQIMENQINKVACFNMMHVSHYDTAKTYMNQVGTALAQFKHKSYDTKTKTYKYTVKDKVTSNKINQNWKAYQYNKMLKDCMKEDGRIDYKKLNSDFWNRTDGYFEGNWWQDPEKLATAAYVLKLEAKAYGEINIVDMISQYKDGEHNPRLNTLQALANDQRISSYDVSLIDAITTNLYASGINYDESKGTLTAEDLEALQKREKNIIFRKVGNWLENGGLILVEGVAIIAAAGAFGNTSISTSEALDESVIQNSSKYKIGESPRVKSSSISHRYNSNAVKLARGSQGDTVYTGIDEWSTVKLKSGEIYYRGEPEGTNFFTTKEAIESVNASKNELFEGLQVREDPIYGYRAEMQGYKLNLDLDAAQAKCLSNSQFGKGGLEQKYIPNANDLINNKILIPTDKIKLK